MQAQATLKVYEIGRRGRPVATIEAGDLGDPYVTHGPWQKLTTLWSEIVDVARESRELERELLGKATYRRFGAF